MRLLIAEDNPITSKVIVKTLCQRGYESVVARDVTTALEMLELHPDIIIVITDLVLGNSDGRELILRLRDDPQYNSVRVVVCTGKEPAALESCGVPAVDVIRKPIRPTLLVRRLAEIAAQELPVLMDLEETRIQLTLSVADFTESLSDFLQLVETSLKSANHSDSSELLEHDDLFEGTRLLRASRLQKLIEEMQTHSAVRAVALNKQFVRELKAVRLRLTACLGESQLGLWPYAESLFAEYIPNEKPAV